MNDMKKALEVAMYERVKVVKDILAGYKDGELNLKNIVDYIVVNASTVESYIDEDLEIKEVRQDDMVVTQDGTKEFYREDYRYYLPRTKFCMEIIKNYYSLMDNFSEDIWTDIQYYGISKSCATMLNKFEKEGRINIIKG